MKEKDATDQSRHSVQEHAEALKLLEELEETDMDRPTWLKKFNQLFEENEHHMDEEEDDVFPLARDALGAKRLDELAEVFRERKAAEFDC